METVTAETIKRAHIIELLEEARAKGETRHTTLFMRTLDGDSIYQRSMLERCADLYNARGAKAARPEKSHG